MNFKEMYKSANEEIHAPTAVLNRVLSETQQKYPRRTFAAVRICAAAAAAIAIAISSVYFYGMNTADEPVKIMQADINKDAATKNTETGSNNIAESEPNKGNAKNNERLYTAPTPSPDKKAEQRIGSVAKHTERVASETPKSVEGDVQKAKIENHAFSATESADIAAFDSVEKCADNATENDFTAYADADISEDTDASDSNSDLTKSNFLSAVSYDEYCEKIGYDIISKAKLPDGISLIKPTEIYIDGAQNSNTFYTTSTNSKDCFITLSVGNSSGSECVVSATEGGYDINVKAENLNIFASAYGFTEEEANTLAKSLSK